MRFVHGLLISLAAAGCAHTPRVVPVRETATAREFAPVEVREDSELPFVVEIWIVAGDGSRVAVPSEDRWPGRRGEVHLLRPVRVTTPVPVTLTEGVHFDYAVAGGGTLGDETVAVAFCAASAWLDRPVRRSAIRVAPPPAGPIRIDLPRAETIEYVGARRLRLGRAADLATFPSYDGVKTVRLRVSRRRDAVGRATAQGSADATLRSLLGAALAGAPERHVSVEDPVLGATRYLCGTVCGPLDEAPAVTHPSLGVPCLAFTSVVAPGFAMARRIETSYVSGLKDCAVFADPEVAVHTSVLRLTDLGIHWVPEPEFLTRALSLAPGVVTYWDAPITARPLGVARELTFEGAAIVPLGRSASGWSAVARVVSWPVSVRLTARQ